jgi:hypothetical protein
MKNLSRLLLIVLMPSAGMIAQTETFDIATFVTPAGWSRSESNGILILESTRKLLNEIQFCQIYLFPSVASRATPEANFQQDWDAHVVNQLGITTRPSPQTTNSPDGWAVVSGFVDALRQGVPLRTVLITATGFGRSISVLMTISPNAYQDEIEKFLKDLNLDAKLARRNSSPISPSVPESASAMPESPAAGGGLDNYVFTPLPSWTAQQTPDGIVLLSPVYNTGERCQLNLFPMRSSSQDLAEEAIDLFRQVFRTDPLTSYPAPSPRMAHGFSPQGWEYFSLRKLVGGQEGEAKTTGVTLLLARMNTQLATIIGTSRDFLISQCFGELQGDQWPHFFASLQFKNAQPSKESQTAIRQRLAGTWIAATSTVGLGYVFQANGRYQETGSSKFRTFTQETTTTFSGDGSYSLDGNSLILNNDNHRHSVMSFRLESVSKDSGQSWDDQLCLADPGRNGEVCYRRQ